MLDVFLRTPYNYDMEAASLESGLVCPEESLAQQSMLEESDINTLVRRFGITGQIPSNVRMPTYDDYTGVDDYHEALNAIALANESFEQMPAEVRRRFNNDPGDFVDFCSNPANRDEAIKLGLVDAVVSSQAADLAAGPGGLTSGAGSPPVGAPPAAPGVA